MNASRKSIRSVSYEKRSHEISHIVLAVFVNKSDKVQFTTAELGSKCADAFAPLIMISAH